MIAQTNTADWENVREDDPDVIVTAKAIAEHGIGRPWNDFLPVNPYDFDQTDLLEYGRAAVAALRSKAATDVERFEPLIIYGTDLNPDAGMVSAGYGVSGSGQFVRYSDYVALLSRHSSAIVDVLAERRRQVEDEEFTAEHDDDHDEGELAGAGAAYALNAACLLHPLNGTPIDEPPECWLWDQRWWKPNMGDNPRRDLVKAAALILAEIERLDRAAAKDRE